MSRRALGIIAVISFLVALGTFFFAMQSINRLMTVRKFPVAVEEIPPYTVITAEMLTEKELPKPMAEQPIYTDAADLIGKLTTAAIPPGVVIYRPYAVQPAAFRYVNDPTLEVISFPVEPERAVGGQIKIGQQVDIWRIRRADNSGNRTAASERLAVSVPVVDVRSSKGERAGTITGSERTQVESANTSKERVVPLTILTVAVDGDTAAKITRLMGDIAGQYEVWVSLSALNESNAAAANTGRITTPAPVAFATATPAPTATSMPTATATLAQILIPAVATATPVPTIANPTATPVPTIINPTATDTPTPVPTLPPPPTATLAPTATPEWDYSVVIVGNDILANEGPSFIQGTVFDIAGGSVAGLPIELHWDGGSIPTSTNEGGTFRFVVTAGEYDLRIPEYSTEHTRIVIPDIKNANRVTLDVRQVR